jgi:hypothetical protein
MAVREGKWRCPFCAGVNLGRELRCGGCGATRDKDVSFFLDDEAPEVTDAALLEAARAGADWLCAHCQTSNRPDAPRCRNCGAERGDARERPVQELLRRPPPAPPSRRTRSGARRWLWPALALLAATTAGVAYCALRTTSAPVTVAGFEWERTLEVEAHRMVEETAWADELPAGARVLSRSREVRRTDSVQVGTERVKVGVRDLGNGFFEDVHEERPVHEQRPVYAERVRYEAPRWVTARTLRATGADRAPHWPQANMGPREREGRRSERLVVVLRGDREYRLELPAEAWSALVEGQTATAVWRQGEPVRLR